VAEHQFESVESYIWLLSCRHPGDPSGVYATILNAVPMAVEKIAYQIPTITLDAKPLLYFAGWKHHISLYPVPSTRRAVLAAKVRSSPPECVHAYTGFVGCLQATAAPSDVKPDGNNGFGDNTQAGVVVAGVSAHPLVGLIDRERMLVGDDPLGLLDHHS
jgi:hypothetical protein